MGLPASDLDQDEAIGRADAIALIDNIAFDEEIGHFDYCSNVNTTTGGCAGLEGAPGDQEPTDGDDAACFPAADSLLVQVNGCNGTNVPGWDGTSYLKDWPDGTRSCTRRLSCSPAR
jgi:hypothetical protein